MGEFFSCLGECIDLLRGGAGLIDGQRKRGFINAIGARIVYRIVQVNRVCLHLLQKEILCKGAKPCILMGSTIQKQSKDTCKSEESKEKAPLLVGKGSFQEDTRKNCFVVLYAKKNKRMTGALISSALLSENNPIASALFAEIKFFIGFL